MNNVASVRLSGSLPSTVPTKVPVGLFSRMLKFVFEITVGDVADSFSRMLMGVNQPRSMPLSVTTAENVNVAFDSKSSTAAVPQ